MTKIIIDIFMYLFEGMLVFYYSNSLFSLKRRKRTQILFVALVFALLFSIYQLSIDHLNAVLIFISYSLLFCCLYNISFKTAAFHSFIFIIVMFASEILVLAISTVLYKDFNAYADNTAAYLFVVITSKLIYFGIMMVILKLFAQKENKEQDNKYFWLLFIMPLVSILILFCFRYIAYQIKVTQAMSVFWAVLCIGILFVNILVFAIYGISIKNTKELYELKAIQHQEEQDKRYFEIIEQSNNDMRAFSHDIKNHLTQIRNFEKVEDIQRYVEGIYPDVERFDSVGISKNKMLDLIISKYIVACKNNGIKFDYEVRTADLDYIDDTELSIILNNVLDNAVEAAVKSQEKQIELSLKHINNMDLLSVINSCDTPPKHNNRRLITTKFNSDSHGLGTKIIEKHAKKNNGKYEWFYDENEHRFHLTILFQRNNTN